MFELFVALFGGLYYGGKISGERASSKQFYREIEIMDKKFESLECSYDSLWSFICKMDDEDYRWKIANTLSDDLVEIFGQNWREILDKNQYQGMESFYCSNIYWASVIHLYYARKGKTATQKGKRRYDLHGMTDIERTYVIKTCKIIEKYIQMKYPGYSFVFIPKHDYDSVKKKTVVYHNKLCLGYLCWNFDLFEDSTENENARRLW